MVSLLLWFLLDFSHSCWFSQLVPGLGWKFLEGLSHTPEASVLIVGWDALVLLPVGPVSQQKSKNFPVYNMATEFQQGTVREDRTQWAGAHQTCACLTLANVPPVQASHLVKPRINGRRNYIGMRIPGSMIHWGSPM